MVVRTLHSMCSSLNFIDVSNELPELQENWLLQTISHFLACILLWAASLHSCSEDEVVLIIPTRELFYFVFAFDLHKLN